MPSQASRSVERETLRFAQGDAWRAYKKTCEGFVTSASFLFRASFQQNPIAFAKAAIQIYFENLVVGCADDETVAMPPMQPAARVFRERRHAPILPHLDHLRDLVLLAAPRKHFWIRCAWLALDLDRLVNKLVHLGAQESRLL